MPTRLPLLPALAFLCLAALPAQDLLRGPSLGWSFHSAHRTILPISGIPGAAAFGAPLFPRLDLQRALVAPGGGYALAQSTSAESLLLLDPAHSEPVPLAVPPAADLVAFSTSGRTAALYYSSPRQILVLTGLPDSPEATPLDCELLPGELRSLAVRDDGAFLLAGVMEDGEGSVYSIQPGGSVLFRFSVREPAAIVLSGGGRDAYIADRSSGRILRASGIGAELTLADSLSPDTPIDKPEFMAVSREGDLLLSASRDGKILVLSPSAATVESLDCQCELLGITRLNGNAVFALQTPPGASTLLLEAASSPPRIVFVPAPSEPVVEEPLL